MLVDLSKEEMEGLAGLIDAGVRATGIRGAIVAASVIPKLEQAIQNDMKANPSKYGVEDPKKRPKK